MMLILGQVRSIKYKVRRVITPTGLEPPQGLEKYLPMWVQFCVVAIPRKPQLLSNQFITHRQLNYKLFQLSFCGSVDLVFIYIPLKKSGSYYFSSLPPECVSKHPLTFLLCFFLNHPFSHALLTQNYIPLKISLF